MTKIHASREVSPNVGERTRRRESSRRPPGSAALAASAVSAASRLGSREHVVAIDVTTAQPRSSSRIAGGSGRWQRGSAPPLARSRRARLESDHFSTPMSLGAKQATRRAPRGARRA